MNQIPQVKKIGLEEKTALLDRLGRNALTPEDCEIIRHLFDTIEFIIEIVNRKNAQLKTLLKRILGIKSEKSKKIRDNPDSKNPSEERTPASENTHETKAEDPTDNASSNGPNEEKPKGHGRIGADAHTGAKKIFIPMPTFKPGDRCPECLRGKVYPQSKPGVFISIEGQAPMGATVWQLEKYRCNLCGMIFSAEVPEDVALNSKGNKFDPQAKSMIAILRYGGGFPLNRIGELQKSLGIPTPVSTLWEKTEEAGDKIYPAYEELKRQAARGTIIHNDDTGIKILSVMKEIGEEIKTAKGKTRTGMFTTGIVSVVGEREIALFFTGRRHAGENFADLLEKRAPDRDPPIQMCDAKSGNTPKDAEVVSCYCNTHARRNFVNVAEDFPDQCLYVIDVFGKICQNDALARERQMSPDERLQYHQEKSGPTLESFHVWLNDQFDKKQVEPNSSLGKAIAYVLKHWKELTRFLHVPGAPLDNNICERALKKVILHRKNSLFYKTEHGAYVGDMFMSLIHTCNLAGENPFDYLTNLQTHSSHVFKNPEKWLPWNYRNTLTELAPGRPGSQSEQTTQGAPVPLAGSLPPSGYAQAEPI